MTQERKAATDAHDERRAAVLLQGEGDSRYLLPVEVLEAFRVDEAQLAALTGQGDVEGYWMDFTYWWAESTYLATSYYAGRTWATITGTLAGSTAKFEISPDRAVAGVRG
jgi:hypothetical protein